MDRFAQLQALVAVVDAGSFSRAAERLGLAKSVVSRRVSSLEADLGTQLLRRTTRTLSLTASGRAFHARALRLLADLDEAEQSLMDAASALRGRLRIAAPLSFGLLHLHSALSDFLTRHPAIELDLDLNDREVNLVEEGFDIAVRIGELRDSTLIARRLGRIRFVACASPDYLARHGEPAHPTDLASHVGLHYTHVPLRQGWRLAGERGEVHNVLPGIRMQANNGEVLAAAAVAGLGILISPTFIVSKLIESGELRIVLPGYTRASTTIQALFPPGRLIPRRVQAFADFLHARYGERPYWDQALERPS